MNEQINHLARQYIEAELSVFLANLGPKMIEIGFPIERHLNFVVDLDVYSLDPQEIDIAINLRGKAKLSV